MKIPSLLPLVLVGLAACNAATTPLSSTAKVEKTVQATGSLAKHVLCLDLRPEALATHAICAAPTQATQTTQAPCLEIKTDVLETYPQCRAVATGGIALPTANIPDGPMPQNATVTSNSAGAGSTIASTTTSITGGVRSVSVTINGITHTLGSDSGPTPMPDWNP